MANLLSLLTGQTEGVHGVNLRHRPTWVDPKTGARMTVYSMGFQDQNGDEVLIPLVVNGQLLSQRDAIEHYYKTGEHLGKFAATAQGRKASDRMGWAVHMQQQTEPGIDALMRGLKF